MSIAEKKKRTVAGILAHVDAGKTTLCESLLYTAGAIRRQGRVDRRDCFLDDRALERARGITIFSKQAVLEYGDSIITLMDTPGHVDFSAEAERVLGILDCAVLVISGTDGVQAHTRTLVSLLEHYRIPCFVFVTKTDLRDVNRQKVISGLDGLFSAACVDFSVNVSERDENIALCCEEAMETYLERLSFEDEHIENYVNQRKLIPCFFGSGLKNIGTEELLSALDRFARTVPARKEFSAKVFKISRDSAGTRLTYMKITGGALNVKDSLEYTDAGGEQRKEKVNQIRICSGPSYEAVQTALPGCVCAVTGIEHSYSGLGFNSGEAGEKPRLSPVMRYSLILPSGEDWHTVLPKLLQLGEEDPQLNIECDDRTGDVSVGLMGKVQAEVFRSLVKDRFALDIGLSEGKIMYRETIADKVEGVGHFEPLRHYAEVHLIMEPGPRGSGLEFSSSVSLDDLDLNWQRLILTHLTERSFPGVLTASPVTDMKITLAAGKAHLKHTEGGDFRQATYRAVRQGLMQAESVLLEPWYSYILDIPTELAGRAVSDLRRMKGSFSSPEPCTDGMSRIIGRAPVSAMLSYPDELAAYSHGLGRLSVCEDGYEPCTDSDKVIADIGYDAESDTENTGDSVFCSHGAGVNIKWNQVPQYMHLESCLRPEPSGVLEAEYRRSVPIDDRELEAIMEREFGPIRRPVYREAVVNSSAVSGPISAPVRKYVIVDGYNFIYASEELKALAEKGLDLARDRLINELSEYSSFTGTETVAVFDAYKTGTPIENKNIQSGIGVVYTKAGETADMYIEALADKVGKNYSVRVVTGDGLVRLSSMRSGVIVVPSVDFDAELREVLTGIDRMLKKDGHSQLTRKLGEIPVKKDGEQ